MVATAWDGIVRLHVHPSAAGFIYSRSSKVGSSRKFKVSGFRFQVGEERIDCGMWSNKRKRKFVGTSCPHPGTISAGGQELGLRTVNDDLAVEVGKIKDDLKASHSRSLGGEPGVGAESVVARLAGIAGPLGLVREVKLRLEILYQDFHGESLRFAPGAVGLVKG